MGQIAQAAAEMMVENPRVPAAVVGTGVAMSDSLLFDPYSTCNWFMTGIRFVFTLSIGVVLPWFVLSINWMAFTGELIEIGIKGVTFLTTAWTFWGLYKKGKRSVRRRRINKARKP